MILEYLLRASSIRSIASILALSLIVTACGDGGVGSSTTDNKASTIISGKAVKGPISNGTVTAYAVTSSGSKGTSLDATTTDVNGAYSLTINYTGSVLLELTGGSYIDEATGQTDHIPTISGLGLQAVISNITAGSAYQAQITPLTSMAAARAQAMNGGFTASNIDAANQQVGSYFGGIDILKTQPINPLVTNSSNGATQNAINYGLILAGFSGQAQTLGLTKPFDLVTALVQDFSDGSFNGESGSTPVILSGSAMNPAIGTTGLATAISSFSGDSTHNLSAGTVSSTLITSIANAYATHTVGGAISGLTGTVVLNNNGIDSLIRSSNGAFTFATAISAGTSYNVTIANNPANQICSISNGGGIIGSTNVTNVAVTCAAIVVGVPVITNINAINHDGQTFVTWMDAAQGDADASYRYDVYRSDVPITSTNLTSAQKFASGILPNSGKLFGTAFNMTDRLDITKPMTIIENGGKPLPMWSGVAVRTVNTNGSSYYAVQVTDVNGIPQGNIIPGLNATTSPITETVSPIQPILLYYSTDAANRGPYISTTKITGTRNLPLMVGLHASQAQGGGAGDYGDYYIYFGDTSMGYRDGLPSVFSVEEDRQTGGLPNMLRLLNRDTIVHPSGNKGFQTYWFGYDVTPQWLPTTPPRAYPFTENRVLWTLAWSIKKYFADPDRIYAQGQSMGGWGTMSLAFHHPEIFAAVFPLMPRMRQTQIPSLISLKTGDPVLMPDGTDYYERMDSVKYANDHHEDLPFLAWSVGRHDGYSTWKEHIDMVKTLTANHHGFAMAWNNGNHSQGPLPMATVKLYYTPDKFSLHQSYPAFGNSSIDDNMGSGILSGGEYTDGDLVGGINLGFSWSTPVDTATQWSISISNSLATSPMTVDVTPRRCQKFRLNPGDQVTWTNTAGGSGTLVVDSWGLVTVPNVSIMPGASTTLTIQLSP